MSSRWFSVNRWLRFLAKRCNLHCRVQLLSWYVVFLLSVVCLWRGCIYNDETDEAKITRFCWIVGKCHTLSMVSLMTKLDGSPLVKAQTTVGWFHLPWQRYVSEMMRDSVRSQVINNRSHICAFKVCISRWHWTTLSDQNAYAVTDNQKIIVTGATFGFC